MAQEQPVEAELLYQQRGIFRLFSLQKGVALAIWVLSVGGYLFYSWYSGLTFLEAIMQLNDWLHSSSGPFLYVGLFLLRSLLFFSAGILSIVGGIIFAGGVNGNLALAILYVLIGTLLSALLSFGLARYFGAQLVGEQIERQPRWAPYLARLRQNGFMAVLFMRLLLLPFDPINYLAGFARVGWGAFALATLVGIVPTAFAFVSFGAAIDLQALAAGEMPNFDWRMLLLACVILVGSLAISHAYQRRVD
ncbi:MAG: VTT domain-containing protein [Caldilineaceae bacterium]